MSDELSFESNDSTRYGNVERWRHEYKYRIDARQEEILKVKAACVLMRDPHVRRDGSYVIRSLYLDDMDDTCLRENLSGSDPRSKFRIRYYNSDTHLILLEKKSKCRSMCRKESCELTREESEKLVRGEIVTVHAGMEQSKQRLLSELELRMLVPKVIVTYERIPFVYSGGNVRVTFDRKISSSNEIGRFLSGDYSERPVLPGAESVLEVKWDELLPKHIRDTLRLEHLEWTAFSKYFMSRRFHL